MKIFKETTVKKISEIFCDVCGECCTDENFGTESATLSAKWGYNSMKDGKEYNIDLCENCFDMTLKFLKEHRKGFLVNE